MGINLNVLWPGEPMSMYHRENSQEGFLVLAGECLLIVQGEERSLRAWDFLHCPGGTTHVIVGVGDGPAVVLAVGARGAGKGLVYPVAAAALKYGAGVDQEATTPAEAFREVPQVIALVVPRGLAAGVLLDVFAAGVRIPAPVGRRFRVRPDVSLSLPPITCLMLSFDSE